MLNLSKLCLIFFCHKNGKGLVIGFWNKELPCPCQKKPWIQQRLLVGLLSECDFYLWGLMESSVLETSLEASENYLSVAMDTSVWKPCIPLLPCDCILTCAYRTDCMSSTPSPTCAVTFMQLPTQLIYTVCFHCSLYQFWQFLVRDLAPKAQWELVISQYLCCKDNCEHRYMNAMPGEWVSFQVSFSFILWCEAQQTNCNQPELPGISGIGNFSYSENSVPSYMRMQCTPHRLVAP